MKNNLLLVGTSYTDYRDFVGGRIGMKGGIHNVLRAYPDCDALATDSKKCWFKQIDNKLVKEFESASMTHGVTELKNRDMHFCYGDSDIVLSLAKEWLPKLSSKRFVSVDMIQPFRNVPADVLEFWSKYADFIFVATDKEITEIPRIVRNSEALWIFHNPKWVITMCGDLPPIKTENPYYEEFMDTIGAGDYFAGCILRRLFDETGTIDELEACEEVASMLRIQNEIQYGNTPEW